MVNNRVVSRYVGALPAREDADRKIVGGPLYSPDEILALLAENGVEGLVPWTRKCKNDMQKFGIDKADLQELLQIAVRRGRFLGSEWCVQYPEGPWAACDAYQAFRLEWVAAAHKNMEFEYYLKFAIGKTGKVLLLASCHLSQDRS